MKSQILENHFCGGNDGEDECKCFKEAVNIILKLINDEIVIAHLEGTPTSRLTSLYNKIIK
jgi:hypothetical protein